MDDRDHDPIGYRLDPTAIASGAKPYPADVAASATRNRLGPGQLAVDAQRGRSARKRPPADALKLVLDAIDQRMLYRRRGTCHWRRLTERRRGRSESAAIDQGDSDAHVATWRRAAPTNLWSMTHADGRLIIQRLSVRSPAPACAPQLPRATIRPCEPCTCPVMTATR
jgi:hypothetical protein